MSLFGIVVFLAVVLACFFVPPLVRWQKDAKWLTAKRFFAGSVAVGLLVATLEAVFWGAIGPKGAFQREIFFLWLGTSVYWVPLLAIRITQLGMKERRLYATAS